MVSTSRRAWLWVLAIVLIAGVIGAPWVVGGQRRVAERVTRAVSSRSAIAARFPTVRWVDTETLARWLAGSGDRIVLLDARAIAEHRVSHLRGGRWIDPDRSPDLASLALPDRARVVVYCSVGWRSAAVAERLREAGHQDVYNLQGGIFAWANEGREVVREETVVREVHPYDATWGRMLEPSLHAYEPR